MQPKIYRPQDHGIDASHLDPDALSVLKKLRDAGYVAYLVGGSVRDLVLSRKPKDFDISTSALPEEIKALFGRQCILIGRRFRLAHIRFGPKVLELSTFRAGDSTECGLIVQDNQWGTPEEDVLRRDFTINGLFYNSEDHTIIDYVGGWEDLQQRVLRTIGDPKVRFKQDPVRMIRLLKFRARLDFEIEPSARKALVQCRPEIEKSSPARVLEEIFRMLESGSSMAFFVLMAESCMLDFLFPNLAEMIKGPLGKTIYRYLAGADRIHNKGNMKRPLDRSTLVACLLFPILEDQLREDFIDKEIQPRLGDVMAMGSNILRNYVVTAFTHFPKRITSGASFVLTNQYRLTPIHGKKHHRPKIIRNREFINALHLLKIRALVDETYYEEYASWRDLYRQLAKHTDKKHHHPPPKKKSYVNRKRGRNVRAAF